VFLEIAQQHLLFLAIDHQIDDGGMESFLLQFQEKVVVIGFDHLRRSVATVNDARNGTRTAQAAARTRTLNATCRSNDFKLHGSTPKISRTATSAGRFKKT